MPKTSLFVLFHALINIHVSVSISPNSSYFQNPCVKGKSSLGYHNSRSSQIFFASSIPSSSALSQSVNENIHLIDGLSCREVSIDIRHLGPITILEATLESQDTLVEAACSTDEEIEAKYCRSHSLPLKFGDPYGSVLWPAASTVSEYLVGEVSLIGQTVLELGTGTGLCSMTAAMLGASRVMASDYEELPLKLLDYAANNLMSKSKCQNEISPNQDISKRMSKIETFTFDICDHDKPLPLSDVVIAADIMYEPKTGIATALRTAEALKAGSRVIIGCSPGRPGKPKFKETLKNLLPEIDTNFKYIKGRSCLGPRNELICGRNSESASDTFRDLDVALLDLNPAKTNSRI